VSGKYKMLKLGCRCIVIAIVSGFGYHFIPSISNSLATAISSSFEEATAGTHPKFMVWPENSDNVIRVCPDSCKYCMKGK